ncbi:DUF1256 domain-containing protein, partial [Bacillus licheniformis]|uniref:DUF1256 domain-containing protein n=1 Tax=Bacillus licheniformis TaxID=1402 RepID=UPI0011A8E35D
PNHLTRFHLYPTRPHPIHPLNLNQNLDHIHHHHQNPFITPIHPSLPPTKTLPSFQIPKPPLNPAPPVHKTFPQ